MSGADDLVAAARAGLRRLTPAEARQACAEGALLVDTRTDAQRARQGELPGALVIDRTVLEWRLDPGGRWRIPELTSADQVVVVVCSQGYSSSLAAASLQAVGLLRATDMIGGALAWIEAGLPVHHGPTDVRE